MRADDVGVSRPAARTAATPPTNDGAGAQVARHLPLHDQQEQDRRDPAHHDREVRVQAHDAAGRRTSPRTSRRRAARRCPPSAARTAARRGPPPRPAAGSCRPRRASSRTPSVLLDLHGTPAAGGGRGASSHPGTAPLRGGRGPGAGVSRGRSSAGPRPRRGTARSGSAARGRRPARRSRPAATPPGSGRRTGPARGSWTSSRRPAQSCTRTRSRASDSLSAASRSASAAVTGSGAAAAKSSGSTSADRVRLVQDDLGDVELQQRGGEPHVEQRLARARVGEGEHGVRHVGGGHGRQPAGELHQRADRLPQPGRRPVGDGEPGRQVADGGAGERRQERPGAGDDDERCARRRRRRGQRGRRPRAQDVQRGRRAGGHGAGALGGGGLTTRGRGSGDRSRCAGAEPARPATSRHGDHLGALGRG